nr:hypothetical protein [Tanacetum cinerariifolium]
MEIPSKEDVLSFIKELGYSGNREMLSTIHNNQMHQPLRTFDAVINKCIFEKTIGLDRLRELRAQILEISSAKKEHMPYPRFTKVIINHFISKDNTISMSNRINLHTVRDDTLLGTLKFVSKTEDYQKYGALIPDGMINDDIKLSIPYKTYLDYATGKVPPKKVRKFKKPASPKPKTVSASPKEPTQKEVLDKQTGKTKDISEGTGVKPGVPDMSKEDSSDSDDESWGDSEDESNDVYEEDDNDDDDGNDDDAGNDAQNSKQTNLDDDENPSFTLQDYEEEEQDEEYVHTPEKEKSDDEEKMYEEEGDDVAKELYRYLNITQGLRDTNMINAEQGGEDQQNDSHESGFVHEEKDAHVTLTTIHDKTEAPLQSSFVSSYFTSKLLNLDDPSPNINSLMDTSTVPPPPPPINPSSHLTTFPQQHTPDSIPKTTNPTMSFLTLRLYSSWIKGCLLWKLKCLSSTNKSIC